MSTLDVLRAAREYISDPARWRKLDYGYDGGPRCMIGACASAARVTRPGIANFERGPVIEALARAVDVDRSSVFLFNDRPETTHAEVLVAFDRAIAVEEAKAAEFTATPEPAPLVAA